MSPDDLARFALTALARHRLRTALSLLGVAIGVAAVVALTALGEGARRYVTGQFSSVGSNLLIILPGKNETTGMFPGAGGVPNDLTLDDAEALRRGVPQARVVAPLSMGNETIAHRERRRQVIIAGTTREFLEINQLRMAAGQPLPRGEMDRGAQLVLLGAKVAEELFPNQQAVGRVVRIGDWRMRVRGVLARRGTRVGFDLDDFAIVPVATGMQIFNRRSLFRIMIEMNAYTDMDRGCARALEIITERHEEEDVTCITQESVVSSLSTIMNVLTLALGGIAAVSLCVAGIGIMNLMLVSVSERTQEVGLLKAVGADRGQILAVFLAEAVLIAALGGVLGLLIAWTGIWILVTIYPTFPAHSPLWAVVAALATSLCVGALFGVLPARRAAGLDPVAALVGK